MKPGTTIVIEPDTAYGFVARAYRGGTYLTVAVGVSPQDALASILAQLETI